MVADEIVLNNINHNIRTPLNSIIGFSSLLTQRTYEENKIKEFSQQIKKSGDKLLSYLDNLVFLIAAKEKLYFPKISEIGINQFVNQNLQFINEILDGNCNYRIVVEYSSYLNNSMLKGDINILNKLLSSLLIDNILNDKSGKINIWYKSDYLVSINLQCFRYNQEPVIKDNCSYVDEFDKGIYSRIAYNCIEFAHNYVLLLSNHSNKTTNLVIQSIH